MINFLKKILEEYTNSKVYRNSLPRGTDLCHDLRKLSPLSFKEIWDIGAHRGETTLYFANEFPQATIRSFEPVSSNYNLLVQNCKKRENVYANNFAIGKENKRTKIYLQGASVIHSLRDDLNKPSAEDSKSEDIEIKTVDYLINEFNSTSIDLLKVDVEGYEIKVLEGAYKSLAEKKINFMNFGAGHGGISYLMASNMHNVVNIEPSEILSYNYDNFLSFEKTIKKYL